VVRVPRGAPGGQEGARLPRASGPKPTPRPRRRPSTRRTRAPRQGWAGSTGSLRRSRRTHSASRRYFATRSCVSPPPRAPPSRCPPRHPGTQAPRHPGTQAPRHPGTQACATPYMRMVFPLFGCPGPAGDTTSHRAWLVAYGSAVGGHHLLAHPLARLQRRTGDTRDAPALGWPP
jgi:hypothetical protein